MDTENNIISDSAQNNSENQTSEGTFQSNVENIATGLNKTSDNLSNHATPVTSANIETEKPIETYKKVKLKRSHILNSIIPKTPIKIDKKTEFIEKDSKQCSPTNSSNTLQPKLTIDEGLSIVKQSVDSSNVVNTTIKEDEDLSKSTIKDSVDSGSVVNLAQAVDEGLSSIPVDPSGIVKPTLGEHESLSMEFEASSNLVIPLLEEDKEVNSIKDFEKSSSVLNPTLTEDKGLSKIILNDSVDSSNVDISVKEEPSKSPTKEIEESNSEVNLTLTGDEKDSKDSSNVVIAVNVGLPESTTKDHVQSNCALNTKLTGDEDLSQITIKDAPKKTVEVCPTSFEESGTDESMITEIEPIPELLKKDSSEINNAPEQFQIVPNVLPELALVKEKHNVCIPTKESSSASQNVINTAISLNEKSDTKEFNFEIQQETVGSIDSINKETSSDIKRVPKITIKTIKNPYIEIPNNTDDLKTVETQKLDSCDSLVIDTSTSIVENVSDSEGIPKLTIRNIKKSQDISENLEVIPSACVENTENEIIPKLTIKPIKRPTESMEVASIEVPKLTITTKVIEIDEFTSRSVEDIEDDTKNYKTASSADEEGPDESIIPNSTDSSEEEFMDCSDSIPEDIPTSLTVANMDVNSEVDMPIESTSVNDKNIDISIEESNNSQGSKSSKIIENTEIQPQIESSFEIQRAVESIQNIDSSNIQLETVNPPEDVKRVPKITIKSVKKTYGDGSSNADNLTASVESHSEEVDKSKYCENPASSSEAVSSLEAIPKLTIRNIISENLEVVPNTENPLDTVPKLTIKSVKRPVQNTQINMHVVTSELKENLIETVPKLTIKTKIVQNADSISESSDSIPKLTIKTGKKSETIEKLTKQCDSTVEEALPKITIKNTLNRSFEIIPNSISLSENSSEDECVEYSNVSKATKSSLAAANMELISRSSKIDGKINSQTVDSDDEEIEVIPSVLDKCSTEFVPKLSIKALKKSLQSENEKHQEETKFKTIPSSKSSRLIIKPILNAHLLDDLRADPAPQSLLKTIDMTRNNDYGKIGGFSKNNHKISAAKSITRDESPISKLQTRKLAMNMIGHNLRTQHENDDGSANSKNDRIVLKINKDNESMRSHLMTDPLRIDTTVSPLEKITLKLSKEGGHPEILSPSSFSKTISPSSSASLKRMLSPETTIEPIHMEHKKAKTIESSIEFSSRDVSINVIKSNTSAIKKLENISDDVTIVRVSSEKIQQPKLETSNSSKLKDILMKFNANRAETQDDDSSSSDDVKIVEIVPPSKVGSDPLLICNDESSSQDVMIVDEIHPEPMEEVEEQIPNLPATPKKRGRPRKIPLEVRPELKEEPEPMVTENVIPVEDIQSPAQVSDEEENFDLTPKRGFNLRGGRRGGYRSRRGRGGRGSRGGRGAYKRKAEEKRRMLSDLKAAITSDLMKSEAFLMEEDTRMSADGELGETGTHIKPEITDESRSSSTTTEHRNKRGRLEITEIDVHVTGPDQIAEYNWGDSGPYMLQEQVAQYLGVKSFKRKYPGLTRHAVDMQERDYIRENGLASEALCDMGLTAVPSAEILDIMFTDFQDKYEEYRKHQREKQAKDVTNKQRAMATSMATNAADKNSKEESVLQKAIRSAASWNASLNKSRKEERKCYLDMQSFVVMYPRGRKPVSQNTNPGDYPIALVPGQFSEFYKNYTPSDLKYLPVNTVLYGPVVQNAPVPEIIYSDGSCSESESSSGSDSESSDDSDSTTMDGITTPLTNPPPLSVESDTCKICISSSPKSRPVKSSVIYCAQCNAGIHPQCIDLTIEMMPYIQAYPWQCTDCKTCWQCRRPSDDDKMLFCDRCDRGYHIYCVGLRKVPNGRWHCQQCTMPLTT